MVALVGHSGAGKSTLVNLVPRFYDPDEGAVLVDGIDVRTITRESLLRNIGIVTQSPAQLAAGPASRAISSASSNGSPAGASGSPFPASR